MKTKFPPIIFFIVFLSFSLSNAQINLGERALGALQKGVAGFTFSDEQAAQLSKEAVIKMDAANVIATATNPYAIRLNRIFGKHANTNGVNFNYKVYVLKEVNAFATADGSVRVYSGLMDIMDDNELLVVIGHEIGHVINSDSRDAIKAAYQKEALLEGLASQSTKIAVLTDGQLGKIGSAMIDSKHSRKQETEADTFAYDFMKNNGYDVNAVESAFNILAKMSNGAQSDFLSRMMSSHPDPKTRAENAKLRAEKEGVYKLYVQKMPVVAKPKAIPAKKPTKKPTKK
jgi:putative metalloprotease